VAAEDGIELEEAKEKVRESNRKRGKFVWDMFHRRLNDPTNFDLVINTDKLASMDPVVDMIIAMQEATGLDLPKAVAAAG
jgi:cytidylate kinase